ncbi:hypothetical protein F5Y14DRAFT_434391 [Nemania sp. NC0429]|nr:hypothetical protein F5Y14DRAFT_434391 [Nemania sp. NC0429]
MRERTLPKMRNLSLLCVSLLATFALGDDNDLPPPGSPALPYTNGSFSEPSGNIASYSQGNRMNISWTTVYETTSIFLITGYVWAAPKQITTNSAQTWTLWDVETDSTNSSEIYVFRAVNGTADLAEQNTGGFLSAAFFIPVKEPSQSSSSSSSSATPTPTTSATSSAKTSSDATTTPTPTPTNSSPPSSGLADGAKIGIGVGVGVGGIGLAALATAFFFWRRSKKAKGPPPQPYEMPLNGDFPPAFQGTQHQGAQQYTPETQQYTPGTQQYTAEQQAMAGYYKPPQFGETRGAELDAGQGHHYVPEASPDDRTTRAELQ